jgi:glycosyltransferase involved in cell wall biosynthesis
MKPTLHVLGIPHTITRPEFSHDAFTNKVRILSPMMRTLGYHVVHYGVGGAESGADENIHLLSEDEFYGLIGGKPDLRSAAWYYHQLADASKPHYKIFNERLAGELRRRVDPERDIVCCTFGTGHKAALDLVPELTAMESGIGYPTSYLPFRVFESYAWMHNTLGREGSQDGNDYWWVIPNAVDLSEWECHPEHRDRKYVLFVGRIGDSKGMSIFAELAKYRPDLDFVFVGQGDPKPYLDLGHPNLHYRPPVHGMERVDLYAQAIVTVCLTRFLEPFGQVHIESQLCGTPVITSNFGVFPETVVDGFNGYRCNTLGDDLAALELVDQLDNAGIQREARARYGMESVAPLYDNVFVQIDDLRRAGYYTMRSRHGPIHHAALPADPSSSWEEAQKWELNWWMSNRDRWGIEQGKQRVYAGLMGMPADLDFGDASILDIGCGPVSLLRSAKFGRATAIDPLDFGDAESYRDKRINRVYAPAETWQYSGFFDEVWIYNVLQHVEDPHAVLAMANTWNVSSPMGMSPRDPVFTSSIRCPAISPPLRMSSQKPMIVRTSLPVDFDRCCFAS